METEQDQGSSHSRINLTVGQLYERVWSESFPRLAHELRCDPQWLKTVCRDVGIPLPPATYWQRKRSGHRAHRQALPKAVDPNEQVRLAERDPPTPTATTKERTRPPDVPLDADVAELLSLIEQIGPIEVAEPNSRRRLHPAVATTVRVLRQTAQDAWFSRFNRLRRRDAFAKPVFLAEVSRAMIGRAAQLLQAIAITIEQLGGTVVTDRGDVVGIELLRELHRLRLRERLQKQPNIGSAVADERPIHEWRPTWQFELHLESWPEGRLMAKWCDDDKLGTVECRLSSILSVLVRQVQVTRNKNEAARLAFKEQERERRRLRREAEEAERAKYRAGALAEVARGFEAHRLVRGLLMAYRGCMASEEDSEWLRRAHVALVSLDVFADGCAGLRQRVEKVIDDKLRGRSWWET